MLQMTSTVHAMHLNKGDEIIQNDETVFELLEFCLPKKGSN